MFSKDNIRYKDLNQIVEVKKGQTGTGLLIEHDGHILSKKDTIEQIREDIENHNKNMESRMPTVVYIQKRYLSVRCRNTWKIRWPIIVPSEVLTTHHHQACRVMTYHIQFLTLGGKEGHLSVK